MMEDTHMRRAVLAVVIGWMAGYAVAYAQAVRISNGVAFVQGTITVKKDVLEAKNEYNDELAAAWGLDEVHNNALVCTPVHPLKQGDVIVADISDQEIWSRDTVPLSVGTQIVMRPILGLIAEADSTGFILNTIYPAVCESKIDIKAGVPIHIGGYTVEAGRSVKAGDSIPAVCIDGRVIFSVGEGSEIKPWLTAFPDTINMNKFAHGRAAEVWKKGKDPLIRE
jgi:hypothetical protein